MSAKKLSLKRQARAFAIWREGVSVGWNCTANELSVATNIPVREVRRLAKAGGWPLQAEEYGSKNMEVLRVDKVFRRTLAKTAPRRRHDAQVHPGYGV